jgi:hypothetical protein
MVPHECPTKKVVYVSNNSSNPKAVVIFQGCHSHPPWPEEKPKKQAKDDLQKCLNAYGMYGATAGRVDNGECKIKLHLSVAMLLSSTQLLQQLHFLDLH